jgi:seipin
MGRYLMYNWRLTSFVIFTTIFWGVELSVTGIIWLFLSTILSSKAETPMKTEKAKRIKQEEVSVEEPSPKIKEEPKEAPLHEVSPASEGDIEDEEEPELGVIVEDSRRGAPSDSGLGTSLESSHTREEMIRRRTSRQGLDKK